MRKSCADSEISIRSVISVRIDITIACCCSAFEHIIVQALCNLKYIYLTIYNNFNALTTFLFGMDFGLISLKFEAN